MGRVISRGPQQCLAWPEELNRNPPWVSTRLSVPSIAEPSPDGRDVANILHEDATLASTHSIYQACNYKHNYIYTLSAYMSQINRSWVQFYANQVAFPGSPTAYFNLAAGIVGISFNTLDVRMRLVALGWYRIWITYQAINSAARDNYILIAEGNNDSNFDGLDQDSVLIWYPQINEGWGPDPVIPGIQEVPRT